MEAAQAHSGDEMEEEIIEEPSFDAASYSFHSANSELVKYFYNLKFPNTYSLPSKTVLDLIKNEQVNASLKKSVTSYLEHLNNSNDIGSNIQAPAYNCCAQKSTIHPIFNANWVSLQLQGSKLNKVSNQIADPSTSFSTSGLACYDSVHSIKIPLHTLRKDPKYHPYFKSLKTNAKPSISVPDVTKQMSGLEFNKEEKFSVQPKSTRETQLPKSSKVLMSSPFFRKQNVFDIKRRKDAR